MRHAEVQVDLDVHACASGTVAKRPVFAATADRSISNVAPSQGAQSRKTVRTVVSLILRLAVQREAILDNPVRHLDPIEGGPGSRGR